MPLPYPFPERTQTWNQRSLNRLTSALTTVGCRAVAFGNLSKLPILGYTGEPGTAFAATFAESSWLGTISRPIALSYLHCYQNALWPSYLPLAAQVCLLHRSLLRPHRLRKFLFVLRCWTLTVAAAIQCVCTHLGNLERTYEDWTPPCHDMVPKESTYLHDKRLDSGKGCPLPLHCSPYQVSWRLFGNSLNK